MSGYGQFCPVAKAMEVLDERWTVLVVRELLLGSRRFNELHRGLPRMSPALLSLRLRELVRAGLVERQEQAGRPLYVLTAAGQELAPVVQALGAWGARWGSDPDPGDLDPHLLVRELHRGLDPARLPPGRVVIGVRFPEVTGPSGHWWVVVDGTSRVCDRDPGPATVTVVAPLPVLVDLWRGALDWAGARRRGLVLHGSAEACRALPSWLRLSPFAGVPRPRAGDAGYSR